MLGKPDQSLLPPFLYSCCVAMALVSQFPDNQSAFTINICEKYKS